MPGAGNPQNLNRFMYVNGNPIGYTDPSGHEPCESGNGPYCDGGHRRPNPTLVEQVSRTYYETTSRIIAGYIATAWAADDWLYDNVPSAIGYQRTLNGLAPNGFVAGVTVTETTLFNWRSGELDTFYSGEVNAGVGTSGFMGGVGYVEVMGASSNESWEGPYADITGDLQDGIGIYGGKSIGLDQGALDHPDGPSLVPFVDPDTGKNVTTGVTGIAFGPVGASLTAGVGNVPKELRVHRADFSMPFSLIPPGNPHTSRNR